MVGPVDISENNLYSPKKAHQKNVNASFSISQLAYHGVYVKLNRKTSNLRLGLLWLVLNPLISGLVYLLVITTLGAERNFLDLVMAIGVFNCLISAAKSGINSSSDYTNGIKIFRIDSKTVIFTNLMTRCVESSSAVISVIIIAATLDASNLLPSFLLIPIVIFWSVLIESVFYNFSGLVARVPDFGNLFNGLFLFLFFASPVLYTFDLTSGLHSEITSISPFTVALESCRSVLFGESDLDLASRKSGLVILATVLLSIRGYSTFDRTRWRVSTWS